MGQPWSSSGAPGRSRGSDSPPEGGAQAAPRASRPLDGAARAGVGDAAACRLKSRRGVTVLPGLMPSRARISSIRFVGLATGRSLAIALGSRLQLTLRPMGDDREFLAER